MTRLLQWEHNVHRHDPISVACLLNAVAAAAWPQVGRHDLVGRQLLDEAGSGGPPVIIHGIAEGGNYRASLESAEWKTSGALSLVGIVEIVVLLRQLSYAIKNQLVASKAPYYSLVLYGIRDRWLPCTERSYYRRPYAIKNQRGASKIPPMGLFCVSKPLVGGFGCDELFLYGIRELA